jgi:elongation factor Tu
MELMDAVDEWIPFLLVMLRSLSLCLLKTCSQLLVVVLLLLVVLKLVLSKLVKKCRLSDLGAEGKKTVCTGVEMFRKILDEGQAGDNVGL